MADFARLLSELPTWAMTRAMLPVLSQTHPWYGRRFGLREWAEGQTSLCRSFDLCFWFGVGLVAVVVPFL